MNREGLGRKNIGRQQRIGRALVVLALAFAAESTSGAELQTEVQHIVNEERDRGGVPAISVVVVRDGRVLVEYAAGLADVEAGRVATVDTLYPAASVSKLITAALVMRQVEDGKLDLDEPVNAYLKPAFWVRDSDDKPSPATLRQLLSHNSGLPVSWNGIYDWGNSVPSMEQYLARGQRTHSPPRERVVYANDGFALAGYVAARAAGQTFSEYAQDALLEPLGMSHSTFESPWQLNETMAAAYGHWFKGGMDRTRHANMTAIAPAGGLITTARDLSRFALMILGEGELDGVRVLRPESIAQMLQMQARVHPESDQGFGLGFAVREQPGRRIAWWDGSSSGAASRLALIPDDDVGVVVLSNLANNEPTAVTARRILDVVEPPPRRVVFQPSSEQLDKWTGVYRPSNFVDPKFRFLSYLLSFEVERTGNALLLDSMMTGERELSPLRPSQYRISNSIFDDAMVLFDEDEMYLGHMTATRISSWQSPAAIGIYAVFVVVTVVLLLVRFSWQTVRLVRHRNLA